MTNEEAKKMLKAKLECLKNETSGINYDCNMRLCDGCPLNYAQGNIGEQKEALEIAIKALEQTDILDKIRAEIMDFEEELFHRPNTDYSDYSAVRYCVEIIDKYKSESEDKE